MPYAVTCKACGARFSVADDLYKKRVAGKSVLVSCKQCRAPIRIDASEAPPARRSSARPPSATRQFPSRPPVPQGPARPAPSRLPSIQRTHLGGLTARGAPAAPGSRAAQPPTAHAPAAPSLQGAPKATLQGLSAPRAGGQAAPQAPRAAPQGATKATLQGLTAPKAAPSPPRPRGGNLPLIPQAGPHLADADEEGDEEATVPFGAYFDVSEELESVPPSAGPNSVDLTEDAEPLPPSIPHTALLARGRDPHPPLKAEPSRKTSTGGSIEDDPDFLLGLNSKAKGKTTQDDPPTQRRGSIVGTAPQHEHPHPPSPPAPPVAAAAAATPSPIVAVAAASPPTETPLLPTPSPSAATTAPAPATVSKPIQPPSAAPKPPAPAASRTPQAAAETLRMDAVKLDAPRLDAPSLYDKGQATSSALALPTTDPSAQSKRSSSWGAVLGLLVLLVGLGGVYRYLNPSAEPQAAAPPAQPATPEPPAPKVEAPPAPTQVAEAPATTAAPEPTPEAAAPPAAAPATPEPASPATKPAAPSYASPSPAPAAPREPSKPTSATEKPAPTPATTKPSSGKPSKPTGPVGPFDRAAAASALSSAASQASSCKKSGDPSGTASVTVTFAPSGRVTSANISGPPFAGTATGGCIASTLRRATIPPFEGDRITVSKTVVIR
jgi:hypothetical protein